VLACDFFAAITVTVPLLYVFVVLEVGGRRILSWNVTEHPTAEWTLRQSRMVTPSDKPHRFVIHDRDSAFPGRRCDPDQHRPQGVEDAGAVTSSERLLRAARPCCQALWSNLDRVCFVVCLGVAVHQQDSGL
jgi:hypothetical protein